MSLLMPPFTAYLPTARLPLPFPNQTAFVHGGDYNPDQWFSSVPDILERDAKLMKLAGINSATVGVFSWTMLEPEEGKYNFDWLHRVFDQQHKLGNKVVLATPTGSMPAWVAEKYPDARRVNKQGLREIFGGRHNHCWTSPSYHRLTEAMNTALAREFGSHPALAMWHVSNELSGWCFCDTCRAKWHGWLERKYGTLQKMNDAYWSGFWSRIATKWSDVEPTDQISDGMLVDWFHFNTDQLIDWYNFEASILRPVTPNIPITTNFMGLNPGLDYQTIARHVDVVCDDQYPYYNTDPVPPAPSLAFWAARNSFKQDLYRNFVTRDRKPKTMFLMESCPGAVQWQGTQRQKRPGVHRLEMLQAIAGGNDGTSYFQFRASRNATEKMHGSVVEHAGDERAPLTRNFKAVAELSALYPKIAGVLGTSVKPQVAVVYDWGSKWGQRYSCGTGIDDMHYDTVVTEAYKPFWEAGIPVDGISPDHDFSPYKLAILPALWQTSEALNAKVRAFVAAGGTVVATADTGMCDEFNRMHLGGWPGGLTDLFGLWIEEVDRFPSDVTRKVSGVTGNALGLPAELTAKGVFALGHLTKAETLATYNQDFYAGYPAITRNGNAYFVAARLTEESNRAFYLALAKQLGIPTLLPNLAVETNGQVTAQVRGVVGEAYLFVLNFSQSAHTVSLGSIALTDPETQTTHTGSLQLPPLAAKVFSIKE